MLKMMAPFHAAVGVISVVAGESAGRLPARAPRHLTKKI